jgi:nicotinate dehydrogenase subunit A
MVEFDVNDRSVATPLPGTTPLLNFLRNDLALNGPKFGCGLGQCGACTIMIDGVAARACVLSLSHVAGRSVTTLEGLGSSQFLHPVQDAFIARAGAQCGYCLNGMIMTIAALLRVQPDPTEADLREALRYNLCRCGAHVEVLEAAKLAAAELRR